MESRPLKRYLSIATCAIAATLLLSGCGYLRTKFGNKPDAYKNSGQSRPLEVPPDLERPNTSGALVIPGSTTGGVSATVTDAAPASVSMPATPGVSRSADGLVVSDTVASTWARVGVALERSGAATIESKDESARTYAVKANGVTSQPPGWFKRTITFGRADPKKVTTSVPLGIRISEDAAGSRITIDGAQGEAGQSAARQLLDVLRQRLS